MCTSQKGDLRCASKHNNYQCIRYKELTSGVPVSTTTEGQNQLATVYCTWQTTKQYQIS